MTYHYDQLATYIGEIVDEAINSTMYLNYFHGSVETGFEGMVAGSPVRIDPLGGKYEGSSFVPGGRVYDPINGYEATFRCEPGWPFEDLPGMQAYYWKRVSELFDPWWQTPQPSAFKGQVEQAHQLAHTLAYQGKDKAGPGVGYFSANGELRHIQLIQQRVSNLDGNAILSFEDNFSDRLDDVVNAQDAAAVLAWVGVAGEQNIWVKAQESLANIAGEAVEAMKDARGGGGGGFGALINVVGAISLVAAEFVTDGLATPLVVAGVGMQTASDFVPEKPEDKEVPLGSDNPLGVLDNIYTALQELKARIRKEESWISTRMKSMNDLMYGGERGGFDLSEPPLAHEDRKSQLYMAGEIRADYGVMKTVANVYMPAISRQLTHASGLAEDSGLGAWVRPSDIGMGHSGPYSEWSGLNLAIKGVTLETAKSIDTAADALEILANDFGKSDAEVKADMDALGKRLDDASAAASRSAH